MTTKRIPTAVVTGGASGIGLAFAEAYADRGFRVALADVDSAALSSAVDGFTSRGVAATGHVFDLRDAGAVSDFAGEVASAGEVTAICLNAGVTSTGNLLWETPPEVFEFLVDVNLRGLFNSIQAFIPRLIEQGTDSDVVITASMAGMTTSAYSAAYSASKAAGIAMAKALRAELESAAPFIKVSLLNPGMVKTNLMRTSSTQLSSALAADLIEGAHDALHQIGVSPAEAVSWAMKALEETRFWALPPKDDMFSVALSGELAELREAIR